jgi:uncharacterized repeat protein (TIGR03803 family)
MRRYQIWLMTAACAAALSTLSACDDHWHGGYYPPPVPPTSDGVGPDAMIQCCSGNMLAAGNLIGTTAAGGQFGAGAVFTLTLSGTESIIYSFAGGGANGAVPQSLIQASDGSYYGATAQGGIGPCSQGCGTIFQLAANNNSLLTTLYKFTGASDGGIPNAVIQGTDGNLYGTTQFGGTASSACGSSGCGVVFKLTPTGAETVLHAFAGGSADGAGAQSLIQGSDGNFYGVTQFGGASNLGVVFKITPAGVATVLHAFGGGGDGAQPNTTLIQGSDGNFYGTTPFGGTSGQGVVFRITPAGVETVLHAFAGGAADGANPLTGVIQGSDGNFYGTTSSGGDPSCAGGCGTVYKLTPAGVESTLCGFTAGAFGGGPQSPDPSSLLLGSDGNFYGTTFNGGEFGNGSAFRVTPAGVVSLLYSFGTNNP